MGDVDEGCKTRSQKTSRDGILLEVRAKGESANGESEDNEGRGNEAPHHSETVLQSHECGQEDGKGFIYTGKNR